MKYPVKKQSGITFLGVCIVMGIIATYLLFVLSVFPLYNEYFGLRTIMQGVAAEPKEKVKNDRDIIRAFVKRADINNLNRFGESELRENKQRVVVDTNRKTNKKTLIVTYQAANKLFSNLNLMLNVKEAIPLGEGATSTVSLLDSADANGDADAEK